MSWKSSLQCNCQRRCGRVLLGACTALMLVALRLGVARFSVQQLGADQEIHPSPGWAW